MIQEKRQAIRKRASRLLYAELGAGNGSILLDISPRGCSFQAIAPVRAQEVDFTISVGDGRKVTGSARVAWVDVTGKIGGLRFLDDSPELHEQIDSWMQITVPPEGALRAGEQRDSEAKRRRKRLRDEARAQAGPPQIARLADVPASQRHTPRTPAQGVAVPALSILGTQPAESVVSPKPIRSWTGAGPATLAISLAALLTIMMAHRQEIGRAVMRFGVSIMGEPQKPQAPPSPEQSSAPSVPPQGLAPRSASSDKVQQTTIETEELSGKQRLTPVADRQAPITNPAASPNANLNEDVQSLWSLVEGGDMRAELALADRYMRGEGVTQSCAQARVLLEAAVKRGSDEARRKLDDISQSGCR